MQRIPISVSTDDKVAGIAVSRDEATIAVSHGRANITLYSRDVDGGYSVSFRFFKYSSAPGGLIFPRKLCFSSVNTLLVAESIGRVHEFTASACEHIRVMSVEAACASIPERVIEGIAASDEVIVVAKSGRCSASRVIVLDAVSGEVLRAFGDYGDAPGQLKHFTRGLHISPSGDYVVVTESSGVGHSCRLSMFTVFGEFVMATAETPDAHAADVAFACDGNLLMAAVGHSSNSLLLYEPGCPAATVWTWRSRKRINTALSPIAIATVDNSVYVLHQNAEFVEILRP